MTPDSESIRFLAIGDDDVSVKNRWGLDIGIRTLVEPETRHGVSIRNLPARRMSRRVWLLLSRLTVEAEGIHRVRGWHLRGIAATMRFAAVDNAGVIRNRWDKGFGWRPVRLGVEPNNAGSERNLPELT